MDDEVRIEYQLTEAEYLAANRLIFLSKPNVLLMVMVLSMLLLIGAFLLSLLLEGLFPLWTMILFVSLFEGLLFYNVLVKMPRTYYRGDGKFRDNYEIAFTDEHI